MAEFRRGRKVRMRKTSFIICMPLVGVACTPYAAAMYALDRAENGGLLPIGSAHSDHGGIISKATNVLWPKIWRKFLQNFERNLLLFLYVCGIIILS